MALRMRLVTRQQGPSLVALISSTALENLSASPAMTPPPSHRVFCHLGLVCVLRAWELPEAGSLCVWHALQLSSTLNLVCVSEAFISISANNSP